MTDLTMNYTDKMEIIIHARAGANLESCVREAILLAMQEEMLVILIHSDKRYPVYPRHLYAAIREDE